MQLLGSHVPHVTVPAALCVSGTESQQWYPQGGCIYLYLLNLDTSPQHKISGQITE